MSSILSAGSRQCRFALRIAEIRETSSRNYGTCQELGSGFEGGQRGCYER